MVVAENPAAAHDQGVPVLISQMAQPLDVLLHLGLQGSGNHAPCSLPGQLVQRLCDPDVCPSASFVASLSIAYPFRGLSRCSRVLLTQGYAALLCQFTTFDWVRPTNVGQGKER